MNFRALLLLFTLPLVSPAPAADPPAAAPATPAVPAPAPAAVVDVWPAGKMPGAAAAAAEAEVPRKDGYHRITNVSRPTLTLYAAPAPAGGAASPAVIVCPGGGYSYVVVDKEGSEIAAWLNRAGVSALVLKYRVPNNRSGALQDVQRALSVTRQRAAEWRIDPARVGVMGFSAGGHVAAQSSTGFETRSYPAVDDTDRQSCRPDFAMLVYPAYLDDKKGGVAPELKVHAGIPPTLIVHSEDDKPHVPGSRIYHSALEAAKAAHTFKLYATGGHGYGLHCEREARAWPDDALAWLRAVRMIR